MLTISDIYQESDKKVLTPDSMVLTTVVNGEAGVNIIFDGTMIMYFDNLNKVTISCKKI